MHRKGCFCPKLFLTLAAQLVVVLGTVCAQQPPRPAAGQKPAPATQPAQTAVQQPGPQPAPAAQQPQAPPQPKPIPPPRYIPSHNYDTRNYTLRLRFDWDKEQAIGSDEITFVPLVTDLREAVFDAANMTISSLKLSSGKALQFTLDEHEQKLRISLDRAYQPSETIDLIIEYHTNGSATDRSINGGGGLTFIKPTADDPTRPKQIWSQGESEYNHYWFPCYDHPNDFATTEIYATVEKPMIVISNGKLLDTKENSDNTRTFHWRIDERHATYLTSIIVGEYASVESSYAGIPIRTNVYPGEVEQGKISAARIANMVRFFSEKTGVKYPYPKYDETATRDFNGGMENISATTLTDDFVHDAREEKDRTSDSLLSHELAHQWFGDYVTCRSWSDIWLNESFATYFQAMWDEHSLGHDDFLYRDVKANQDQYYTAWARGQRRPIVTRNYQDPDAVFDTYAYPRGGAVLHMLRTALGDDNWWHAINHYLNKYAHQPVETEQFRIAVEEATGQSMDWFFDEWVYKMGHPVFRVTKQYLPAEKMLKLTVVQEQKPDPGSAYPQAEFFRTPMAIEIAGDGTPRVERVTIEAAREQTFSFKVDAEPKLVNFDYGDTVIKELKFEKSISELIYQLASDQDVTGRIWALDQLSRRLKDKTTADGDKQQITLAVASALKNDKFWGVRRDAAANFGNVPGSAVRDALIAATQDENSRVRAKAIQVLGESKDPALATVFTGFLDDPSYIVIQSAAPALGASKSPQAYDALVKLLDVPSWHAQIRAAAVVGLNALGDPRSLDVAYRYAGPGNPTDVRSAALSLLGAVGKKDPRAFDTLSDTAKRALAQGNLQVGVSAAAGLLQLGDSRGIEVLEQLVKTQRNPQVVSFLQQFADGLRQQGQAALPKPPGH